MARHGENIYKRKDGRYEGRYVIGRTPEGRTRFGYVYGRQYAEVKRLLNRKKAEQPMRSCGGSRLTLRQWMAQWMEAELLGSVKASSYQTYSNLVRRHLLPALGGMRLGELTPGVVCEFAASLQRSGLSYSTAKGAYRLLCAAMRSAQEEGLIDRNPCRRIRLQRAEVGDQRVLTAEEQARLRSGAADDRNLPALLSLYTGMRLGEVCALRWSDVDFAARTITVRRTAQRVAQGGRSVLTTGAPKSARSHRVLPVPDFLLERLEALRERPAGAYVFGGGRAAEPRTVQRRFHRLMRRLGIEGAHFHTLRHTFATRLMELGVDVKTVSVLLGHSSARITLDFYAHSLPDSRRTAMELLASR